MSDARELAREAGSLAGGNDRAGQQKSRAGQAVTRRPVSVADGLQALGRGGGRLPSRDLRVLVELLGRTEELWRPLVRHDPEQRWYARLYHARNVEVWLLGWETGQDTRFHDHGGSSGAFYVAQGMLAEEYGNVESFTEVRSRVHETGKAVPFGPSYVHNLGNREQRPATSIHAYSPPLATMTYYRPERGSLMPYETLLTAAPDPQVDAGAATSPGGCFAPAS